MREKILIRPVRSLVSNYLSCIFDGIRRRWRRFAVRIYNTRSAWMNLIGLRLFFLCLGFFNKSLSERSLNHWNRL